MKPREILEEVLPIHYNNQDFNYHQCSCIACQEMRIAIPKALDQLKEAMLKARPEKDCIFKFETTGCWQSGYNAAIADMTKNIEAMFEKDSHDQS